MIPFVLIIIGLVVLLYSADILVKGSASISKKLNIPSIVIGLTVVAFGTSAPELIVNLFATFKNSTGISLGNIIGSNIANILLVLGATALINTLRVKKNTIIKEIPFALLASTLLLVISNDIILDNNPSNIISRTDGLILIGFFLIFLYYTFQISKNNTSNEHDEIQKYNTFKSIIFLIIGIVGLFIGGKILIDNAIILATKAGLSELLIGATIIAIGTSLPELVTSIMAAYKKQTDIAIGNIVGSCIFNIFWILGLTASIKPIPLYISGNFDIIYSLLATVLLFLILFIYKKHEIHKKTGIFFLILYAIYIIMILIRG